MTDAITATAYRCVRIRYKFFSSCSCKVFCFIAKTPGISSYFILIHQLLRENRFESLDRDFHERMRQAFLDIARRQNERCRLIDASGAEETVAAAIWDAVGTRFAL